MNNNPTAAARTGVVLANLGTPDAPTPEAVRRYLAEFLWDPRVIKVWRPLWWLVLNLFILNTRPQRTAAAYQRIWRSEGSPLLAISQRQAKALGAGLGAIPLALGMRYGRPSLPQALNELAAQGCNHFIILPLYPQFSFTTVTSVEDEVQRIVGDLGAAFRYTMIRGYHHNGRYIAALAASIQKFQAEHGHPDRLLMSFHGIPQAYVAAGDPYQSECRQTARRLAQQLALRAEQWQLTFQSRFGPQQWLQPYTDKTLQQLARQGIGSVQVVCPGFSTDCLETLEEIALENRDVFLASGGQKYDYIPSLNDATEHIAMMAELVTEQLP